MMLKETCIKDKGQHDKYRMLEKYIPLKLQFKKCWTALANLRQSKFQNV